MANIDICQRCTAGKLICPESGTPIAEAQHHACPRNYWSLSYDITFLVGDLAYGGITEVLRKVIPATLHEPNVRSLSVKVASDFDRDPSFIIPHSPHLTSAPPPTHLRHVVHLVSRHPEHTPVLSSDLPVPKPDLTITHLHGPCKWAQECLDHSLSIPAKQKLILANSQYTLDHLTLPASSASLTQVPSRVINLPIQPTRSPNSRIHDRYTLATTYGLDPTRPWWIYCGRSSPEKNIETIIRFRSEIANYGIVNPQLLLLTRPQLKSTQDVRYIPWQDPARFYNASDLCVCASSSEGGPIFTVEALLSGCPVVSTNVGHMVKLPHFDFTPDQPYFHQVFNPVRPIWAVENAFNIAPMFHTLKQWASVHASKI